MPHLVRRTIVALATKRLTLAALALAATLIVNPAMSGEKQDWVGTWTASPQPTWGPDFALPVKIAPKLENQTIRQTIRTSIGGKQFRIVLSNEYTNAPIQIGEAHAAIAGEGSKIVAGTDHVVTFGGQTKAIVPAGAPLVSDPVDLPLDALSHLSISIYLPRATPISTFHWDGKQTAYIGDGNQTASDTIAAAQTTDARILVSEVLIDAPANHGAVIAIGDSITDGNGATLDADNRWPDFLAKRLASNHIAVLNAGISGARLPDDAMGVKASARFDRDVLAQPGAKAVVLLIGINDISWPGTPFVSGKSLPSLAALTDGYLQLAAQAHAHNLIILGGTLTPFEGALSGTPLEGYYTPEKEALRQKVNDWIRTSGAFDAVVDFDALLRDPAHPARLLPEFDSGDHLHPGDKGNRAMAEAIDLGQRIGN
ncbi:SGNH/GDSL hydrolase family protein [Mesorhizobium sp. AR02]|uniref:SGNH/GDSL hydrolase family protein n=1 Tax=Mesorhizobium sp. AR02 TaxID=2865837 RepID=UPI00215F892B|nr:SGNH/GDSL hydrolase family protein [Mesorhizobium sp. AR02]UVK56309.1 SGNH/GDSL hydrolase family protein [Mesorhizobium sp. AR02]